MNDQASQSGVSENLPSGKHVVHNESAEQWMVQPLRRPAYQRSSFRTWLYMVGLLLMLFSATLLPPMAVAGWYDGIEVVFAIVALGGFAPHDASIGYFQDPMMEWISCRFGDGV